MCLCVLDSGVEFVYELRIPTLRFFCSDDVNGRPFGWIFDNIPAAALSEEDCPNVRMEVGDMMVADL